MWSVVSVTHSVKSDWGGVPACVCCNRSATHHRSVVAVQSVWWCAVLYALSIEVFPLNSIYSTLAAAMSGVGLERQSAPENVLHTLGDTGRVQLRCLWGSSAVYSMLFVRGGIAWGWCLYCSKHDHHCRGRCGQHANCSTLTVAHAGQVCHEGRTVSQCAQPQGVRVARGRPEPPVPCESHVYTSLLTEFPRSLPIFPPSFSKFPHSLSNFTRQLPKFYS